jgi:hypothetical protein
MKRAETGFDLYAYQSIKVMEIQPLPPPNELGLSPYSLRGFPLIDVPSIKEQLIAITLEK